MTIDIQALKSAHRLEQIVSERVVLVSDGAGRYKGLCPFHNERTPSFFVYVDDQTFHCFGAGCQAHGDVIAYLQRLNGWTFVQTVEYLMARAPNAISYSLPQRKPITEVDAQLAALQVAVSIYHRDIESRWSPLARQWLAGRGLMPEKRRAIIEDCHLGYCTGTRGPDIIAELQRRGIPIEAAREIGVLGKQGTYEPFRNRLVIPEIRRGVVVWMTGRWLDGDTNTPSSQTRKYLNVRGPRRLLGAERIVGQKEVITVESPLDYLTLVLWRLPGCAMEGGTIPQGDLALFAGCDRIYLPHNRDEAGWTASCKLAKLFGNRAYSIFLPPDIYHQPVKDVNDLAWRGGNPYLGLQLFRECGKRAVPWDDQLWRGAYAE